MVNSSKVSKSTLKSFKPIPSGEMILYWNTIQAAQVSGLFLKNKYILSAHFPLQGFM